MRITPNEFLQFFSNDVQQKAKFRLDAEMGYRNTKMLENSGWFDGLNEV